jgi:hypothetical protein
VEGIEPSQPALETGGVTVRCTRMCRSGKLKTARLGSFPGGRLWLLGLDGFYQLAAHRSCPLLPRAGMIGEKDMHACLSSRSYRAVQSFTGLPFDALLDSRVATGPRDGNTIYVCLMPATVARAAGAFGVTCYLLVDRCSALSEGAGSAGAVLRESREPAVRHVPAARSIPARSAGHGSRTRSSSLARICASTRNSGDSRSRSMAAASASRSAHQRATSS